MKSIVYVKGKSVEDVKNTVNRLVDNESAQQQQQQAVTSVRFKVRTNLPVAELAIRNLNQVLAQSMPPHTPTFPKANGAAAGALNKSDSNSSISSVRSSNSTKDSRADDDLSSVWLIHSNGSYSPAKIFAKIIHKSPNDSPNIIK